MIVTCASCLTKYHLDDSKVSEKGAKVRCSRCKHVFYVVPPPETKEEVAESFESFAKYHEELMGPELRGMESSVLEEREEGGEEATPKKVAEEEEEKERLLFTDQRASEEFPSVSPSPQEEAKIQEAPPIKSPMERWKRREVSVGPTRLLTLLVVIAILVFGLFYLWTEMTSGGKLASYLENPVQTITRWWEKLLGTEKEGLIMKDLTGYEEKVGEFSLYIIEGKVDNQSQKAKKLIKVKVTIFDQHKTKVTEKVTLCGPTVGRGELKNLPTDFFSGEMILQPKSEKDLLAPSGKTLPFMVMFKDLPPYAKEFKVEIVESPSL